MLPEVPAGDQYYRSAPALTFRSFRRRERVLARMMHDICMPDTGWKLLVELVVHGPWPCVTGSVTVW